jgi:hypothetical protein
MGTLRDRASRKRGADGAVMTVFDKAVQYVLDHITTDIKPGLVHGGAERNMIWFALGIDTVDKKNGLVFQIDEAAANTLYKSAHVRRSAYDFLKEISATNILANEPLPLALRRFSNQELLGEFPAPPNDRKKKAEANWERDFQICFFMTVLPQLFDLPETRNESHGDNGISAADAIACALRQRGLKGTTFKAVTRVWHSPEKRKQANDLLNLLIKSKRKINNLGP